MTEDAPLHETTSWCQWKQVTQTFPGKRAKGQPQITKMLKIHKESTLDEEDASLFAAHPSPIPLFPVVIWIKTGENKTIYDSYAIVSDDHIHENLLQCLWTMYSCTLSKGRILMFKKFTFSQMDQVRNLRTNIWYSLFTLFKIIWEQESCGITLRPHLRKGAVDGVGGSVKRAAWNAVSTRKVQSITSAECFVLFCHKRGH